MAQYQFDPSQFGQAPPPKKFNFMKWALAGGCMFSAMCIACCGVMIFFAQREVEKTEEAYGTDIVNMCNPIRTEIVNPDIHLDTASPLQLVVFKEDRVTKHTWHDDLPQTWQADNKDETDLVICVRETEEIIEECEYEFDDTADNSELAVLQRVQQQLKLYVFTVRGDLVEIVTVSGGLPAECPETRRISGTDQDEGPAVTYTQFEDALRPIIESTSD